MKEKQYDTARHNEISPAEGMAAVNTHNPEEEQDVQGQPEQQEDKDSREKQNNKHNDRS